jgi:F-type H+-transporting ATPase subunit delta
MAARLTRGYATEAEETLAGEKGKLTLNLVVPHEKILAGQVVTQVNVTTADGEVGILADHVPSVEQLVPGVLEIFGMEGKDKKYFGMS